MDKLITLWNRNNNRWSYIWWKWIICCATFDCSRVDMSVIFGSEQMMYWTLCVYRVCFVKNCVWINALNLNVWALHACIQYHFMAFERDSFTFTGGQSTTQKTRGILPCKLFRQHINTSLSSNMTFRRICEKKRYLWWNQHILTFSKKSKTRCLALMYN